MTDFSVNLVLNQSTSSPQQYSRSKDQDAAEDREEPCAGAAGGGKGVAGGVANNDSKYILILIFNQPQQLLWVVDNCELEFIRSIERNLK